MLHTLVSLFLALQISVSAPPSPHSASCSLPAQNETQYTRLWWGLVDPELSGWFARIPFEDHTPRHPIVWDWSWRSFLVALFQQPLLKEAATDAYSV